MDTPNSQSKTALAHYQHWLAPVVKQMQALPYSGLALLARFSIAGVCWYEFCDGRLSTRLAALGRWSH